MANRAEPTDDGCCHRTRVRGAPCPAGRACPFDQPPQEPTDDDELERNGEEWKAAYCEAFRAVAHERGWNAEDIESGWLDEWPGAALIAYGIDACPREKAADDVVAAEREVANA